MALKKSKWPPENDGGGQWWPSEILTWVKQFSYSYYVRPKQNICVFQVSRPYLGFCPNPKHFIVNCEQNVVKFPGKWGKCIEKM